MPRRPRVDASMQSLPLDVAGDAALRADRVLRVDDDVEERLLEEERIAQDPRDARIETADDRDTRRGTRAIAARAARVSAALGLTCRRPALRAPANTSRRLTILAARFASR